MNRNTAKPLELVQVQRWRVTRLMEMIQRQYSQAELLSELEGWLATGIERIPASFNLSEAAARAVHARTSEGSTLKQVLPCDEHGRLSGHSRDVIETAIYAALAPHIPQLDFGADPLRTYQVDLDFVDTQNSVHAEKFCRETVSMSEGSSA